MLSIAVAGFLTNTAYHAVERIVQNSPGLMDNEILISKWYFTKKAFRIRFTDIPELQQGYQRFSVPLGLWHYWQILNHCWTRDEYKEILPHAGGLQHPRDLYIILRTARIPLSLTTLPWTKSRKTCGNFSFQDELSVHWRKSR